MNPLKYDMSSENMYYRMMGNTGIQVSILSYGFWATYGVKNRLQDSEGVEKRNTRGLKVRPTYNLP